MKREPKQIHVAILESEDKESLRRALADIKSLAGINFMEYQIKDSHLRIVFAALKEASASSRQ